MQQDRALVQGCWFALTVLIWDVVWEQRGGDWEFPFRVAWQ